jgi:hypothetical protein
MSAEQDRNEQGGAEDLELTNGEADRVKGGVNPVEGGGDAGSSGLSLGGLSWKMRRKKSKKKSSQGSTGGGRPV